MVKEFDTTSEYAGKYVALKSRDDDTVVAYGTEPKRVHEEAIQKGSKNPVLLFVPEKDSVYIY